MTGSSLKLPNLCIESTTRVNNKTSGLFKTAASIHKHNTKYSDKGNYYIQTTNLFLGRKAINVTGPVIRAKIPPYLKKYPQKHFQENLRIN